MDERILTAPETAKILRISTSKLYQLVRENSIPHIKIDGRVVFLEKKLYSWLDAAVCGG